MSRYSLDLPGLFVFAVAVALQMMCFVFVVQKKLNNPLISGLLPVLFLT
jgi:hypothetical protein